MHPGLIRAIIILPGTVLVFVHALLLWLSRGTSLAPRLAQPSELQFWLGWLCLTVGIVLAIWTARLQLTIGRGTPAPWDPTTKLVVAGPYRHVRNPMITGAFFILLAEALLLHSWPIAIWLGIFVILNLIYMPLFEEKALEARFGSEYREYKAHVPRWLPRWRPWVKI